jgi:hypothetical protein
MLLESGFRVIETSLKDLSSTRPFALGNLVTRPVPEDLMSPRHVMIINDEYTSDELSHL